MKKKVNILLLLAVVSLWGAVAYRYAGHFFRNDEIQLYSEMKEINFSVAKKDTFAFEALGRDPFLNRVEVKPTSRLPAVRKNAVRNTHAVKKEVPVKAFPSIKYFGYIKSQEKKEEMVILKVDAKLLRLRLNESAEGIRVVKVFKDSVVVSFMKQTKTIRK